jgi:undecaprenyl-diphosphatase
VDYLQSIVLGLVQGIGEFLPISSSGHLILIPWLFGWDEHSLSFDVMLHAGTLFAVLVYFWREWLLLIKEGFLSIKERKMSGPPERRLFWYIVIASVPGAIIGKLLEEKAEESFRSPLIVASALGAFAVVFYFIDRFSGRKRNLQSLGLVDSVVIGISQAIAIIPGVSRSGATIACGLGMGLDRESSAKFSFLLSAPIIFGATVLKLGDIGKMAGADGGLSLLLGFSVSAVTGLLAIRYLLSYVKKHTFNIFIIYRILFSLMTFSIFFTRR